MLRYFETATPAYNIGDDGKIASDLDRHDTITDHRCHCSYDCCGHRSGYCDVHHLGGTMFMVQVHTSRNY